MSAMPLARSVACMTCAPPPRVCYAALPVNTPGVECILDPQSRVGVVGGGCILLPHAACRLCEYTHALLSTCTTAHAADWLQGSSMQDAAVSGIALAGRLARLRGVGAGELAAHAVGLRDPLRSLSGASVAVIGGFPGLQVAPGEGRPAPLRPSPRMLVT